MGSRLAELFSKDMEPKARLGVLFIHGIGQQSKGETLVNWLDPLARWISAWLTGAQPGKMDPADRPGCLVRSTSLTGDEPPHAYVEIQAPAGLAGIAPTASRILVAEAYWAQRFPPPNVHEVTIWLLEIAPMTLLLHFGLQVRRAFRELRASQGISNHARAGFLL